jgi:hypothetical protein
VASILLVSLKEETCSLAVQEGGCILCGDYFQRLEKNLPQAQLEFQAWKRLGSTG